MPAQALPLLVNLEKKSSSIQVCYLMSQIYFQNKDYNDALAYTIKCIDFEPLNYEYHLLKAEILLQLNKKNEAFSCLEEASQLMPNEPQIFFAQSQLFQMQSEAQKALEILENVPPDVKDSPYFYLQKASVLSSLEQKEQALENLLKAKSYENLNNDLVQQITLELSSIYTQLKEIDKANEVLEEFVGSGHADANIYYLLIQSNISEQDYQKALQYAQQMQQKENLNEQQNLTAMFYIARCHEFLGNVQKAKDLYSGLTFNLRSYSIKNPSDITVIAFRIITYCFFEDYQNALSLCNHFMKLAPNNSTSFALYYFVYSKMGDDKKANKYKAKALEIDPEICLDDKLI